MNKKARLILSLIPILVALPILISLFNVAQNPYDSYSYYNNIGNVGIQPPQPVPTPEPIQIQPGEQVGIGEPIGIDVDPVPILNFFSDTQHTNTTAVLTAVATDFLQNAGIRWIRIYQDGQEIAYKDCQGQTVCTFVYTVFETQNIQHTYYSTTMDLGNNFVQSDSITIIFEGLNQNPIIDSFVPTNVNPIVNEGNSLHFEVWAHDPNGDPLYYIWKLDGNETSTTSSWDYNPDYFSDGYHDVFVIVYDNKGGTAVQTWNVTVNNVLLNSTCYLNFNPLSPITYGTQSNASCYCTNPEALSHMWRNNLNADNENNVFVLLEAGNHNYVCNVTQTHNYRGASTQSIYVVNRANHNIHLALNGQEQNLNVPVGTLTNATGWLEINQDIQNALLFRDGNVVAIGSPATEILILPSGTYNYTYFYPQSQNYTAQSVTRILTVGRLNSTCSLNFVPPSPITYDQQPFMASCSCTNPEAQARLWRNGMDVTGENNQPVTLAANSNGYPYVCNVTQTQNYSGASVNALYIINPQDISSEMHLALNDQERNIVVIYPALTNATGWSTFPIQSFIYGLYRNGQLLANGNPASDIGLLGVGGYSYIYNTTGDQNHSAASTPVRRLTVIQGQTLLTLTAQPSWNVTQGTQTNISCAANNNEVLMRLYRNSIEVANGYNLISDVQTLPQGQYNYTCNTAGSQNWSAATVTNILYVTNLSNGEVHLYLNGLEQDLTINYNAISNATTTTPYGYVTLYRDGLMVANGTSPQSEIAILAAGVYNYTAVSSGDSSHGPATVTHILTVNRGQTILTLTALPDWNVLYPTRTNVSCSANTNEVTMQLFRAGAQVANGSGMISDVITLPVGNYLYVCFVPTSQNWTSANVRNTLVVNQTSSLVNLTLNGIDNDITVNVSDNVTIIGKLIVPYFFRAIPPNETERSIDSIGGGEIAVDSMNEETPSEDALPIPQGIYHIELYLDGVMINSGDRVLTNTTSFAQPGIHNATVLYPGNQNYSSSFETHFITVTNVTNDTQAPVVMLVSPADNSNFTINNVTVVYNVTDNIDLLMDCDVYSNVTGTWRIDASQQTANGTSNSSIYNGLANGRYTWNVECRDDANNRAFASANWTFIINVTQPDLTPPEVWNVSANPNVLNQSQSTILEAFARDNQSGIDTVLARVTYPNASFIDYRMQPGMIQYQYLYNFTDTIQTGTYIVRIIANDTAGNINNSETTSFVVQPIIGYGNTTTIITMPADNLIFNLSQVFVTEANVTAVGGDVLACNSTLTFSNGTVLTTPQPVNALGNINNGNTVTTRWNVTAANVGSSDIIATTTCQQGGSSLDTAYNITVTTTGGDIQPPIVTIENPLNMVYNVSNILINITATDNVAVDKIWFNYNGTNVTYTVPFIETFADGIYTLTAWANDTSGNIGTDSVMFIVNTTGPVNNPPIVTLISPPNNFTFNVSNVTINYNVTDDLTQNLSCNIYSNTSGSWQSDGSQMTANATSNLWNYTNLANGAYLWNVQCNDGLLSSFAPQNWTFIVNVSGPIAHHDVELNLSYTDSINGIKIMFSNGTAILDDPANLTQNQIYNASVKLVNKGTQSEQVNVSFYLVNSTNNYLFGSSLRTVNVGTPIYVDRPLNTSPYSLGQYNVTVNATIVGFPDQNLSDNERNRTINIIGNVSNDTIAPWYSNVSAMPLSPTTYGSGPYNFSIRWQDNVAVSNVIFEFNGVNYTTATGVVCNPGLPVNNTNCYYIFNDLNAGTHNYRWFANDPSNNRNQTAQLQYIINRANTTLNLTAQPSWNVTQGTQTNVSCTANNNEVIVNLYRNGTLVSNPDVQTLSIGSYNYTCNNTASQNWSAASTSNILTVSALVALGDIRLWLNGTEGNLTVVYNNESLKFNASTLYGNVTIRRDGSLIAGPNASYTEVFENLPAGFYNITARSTGDVTHLPASVTYFLTINKTNSSVTLLLDGNNSDITITEMQNVNHTGILNAPTTGNLALLRNSIQFAFGASPLTNISQYRNPGTYNITAFFAGDENYSNGSAMHVITVIPLVHDISVDSIILTKDVGNATRTLNNSNTYLDDLIYASGNVSNVGNANETNINVTFEDNGQVLSWQLIDLNVGQTQQVDFSNDVATDGWHTFRIRSLPIPGELNLINNQQFQDIRVWAICDLISCPDFFPVTLNNTYPLGQPFIVSTFVVNNWNTLNFYDIKTRLGVSPGLQIIPPSTQIRYVNLAPGSFIILDWNVNSTTRGDKTLTTWAGNDEFSNSSRITIT